MANPYIGRVNQQLMFARHQCQLRTDETKANDRLRNQGTLHAGIWHLRCAYRCYLAELAANYKLLKPELPNNAAELADILRSMNKHPGEAQELLRLEQEGFIGQIIAALASIERIESGLMAPAPDQADPLSLVDITDIGAVFDFDDFVIWLTELKALISRHREQMIEC